MSICEQIEQLVQAGAVSHVKLRFDLWCRFKREVHAMTPMRIEGKKFYTVGGVVVERKMESGWPCGCDPAEDHQCRECRQAMAS